MATAEGFGGLPTGAEARGDGRRAADEPVGVRLVPRAAGLERPLVARGDVLPRDRLPRPRRSRLQADDSVAQPVRLRQPGAARRGRRQPPPGVVLALLAPLRPLRRLPGHADLALTRRLVARNDRLARRPRRLPREPAGPLGPDRLRLLPLH